MKTVTKMFVIIALAAVIVFSMTACGDEPKKTGEESSYVGITLKVTKEQVWERTGESAISEAYAEYKDTDEVSIVNSGGTEIGLGDILGGYLNFSVSEPGADDLVSWDELKVMFGEWENVTTDDSTAKGNAIRLITSTGRTLQRERIYGVSANLGLEKLIYVYVNKDCKITGDQPSGGPAALVLDLSLKKGWNLLCRREYSINGQPAVTVDMRQPVDFRWVLF